MMGFFFINLCTITKFPFKARVVFKSIKICLYCTISMFISNVNKQQLPAEHSSKRNWPILAYVYVFAEVTILFAKLDVNKGQSESRELLASKTQVFCP